MALTENSQDNNSKPNVVAVIPARFASTRLPGKALVDIAGKPMVCHVAERALEANNVDRVIVATDNQRIFDAVAAHRLDVVMTSEHHSSGTDRIAEVIADFPEVTIVVNLQGDEPLISPLTIERAIDALASESGLDTGMVTTWEPMESCDDVMNPDVVKIAIDEHENALYFSRSAIPFPRDAVRRNGSLEQALRNDPELIKSFRKHTGLYVYRRDVLMKFTTWPQSKLEKLEALEQLRALEHGIKIKAIEASSRSTGVDTPEDLARVRELIDAGHMERLVK